MVKPITIGSWLASWATTGALPVTIMIGGVTADPLEASVLRNTVAKPTGIRISASASASSPGLRGGAGQSDEQHHDVVGARPDYRRGGIGSRRSQPTPLLNFARGQQEDPR